MSELTNLEAAVKAELAKPSTRQAIEGLENVVLEAVKNILEAAIPSWLRPFIGGLVDSLAEKGIHALEGLTDEALAKLGEVRVVATVGSAKMALTLAPAEPALTAMDTVADWPGPPE